MAEGSANGPQLWQRIQDPTVREAMREIVTAIPGRPRGFFAWRKNDYPMTGVPAYLPMDQWENVFGPDNSEYKFAPNGLTHWEPARIGSPYLVFACVRVNPLVNNWAELYIADLNQPVMPGQKVRIANGAWPVSSVQLTGATIIVPERGKRYSLLVDAAGWQGGAGLMLGGGSSPSMPGRSYWGAFCLDP